MATSSNYERIRFFQREISDSLDETRGKIRSGLDINMQPNENGIFLGNNPDAFFDLMTAYSINQGKSVEYAQRVFEHESAHGNAAQGRCGANITLDYGIQYKYSDGFIEAVPHVKIMPLDGYEISPQDQIIILRAPKDPSPSDWAAIRRLL